MLSEVIGELLDGVIVDVLTGVISAIGDSFADLLQSGAGSS